MSMSKKDQAINIVNRMLARKNTPSRKQIIAELKTKAGLSDPGASTYYQNVKLGRWVK